MEKQKPSQKLETAPYKGVRDFYPEEMFAQNYMFSVMRKTAESFGYVEYNASILEPAELYKAKTGEEIVNEQTYTFKDRGEREVTLRPEMTPTVARMIAGKLREIPMPARWYSIPNLFRYENPQKGRLREHFQLNVDLFGVENIEGDTEVISVAYALMKNFGAKDQDFEIKINSRKIINDLYSLFNISAENSYKISKIIDKKEKISLEIFQESIETILGEETQDFIESLNSGKKLVEKLSEDNGNIKNLLNLIEDLSQAGVKNVVFTPTLMRGFDYYTDIVFEIFDTNPDNRRSLFGGGRYDNLLDIFGAPKVPAVGFGMGDVTLKDFLETRSLIPEYKPSADLYICRLDQKHSKEIGQIAQRLREKGVNVSVDLTAKKVGDQIKSADKQKISFVMCVGEDEIKSGEFKIKNLETGEEKTMKEEDIPEYLKATK